VLVLMLIGAGRTAAVDVPAVDVCCRCLLLFFFSESTEFLLIIASLFVILFSITIRILATTILIFGLPFILASVCIIFTLFAFLAFFAFFVACHTTATARIFFIIISSTASLGRPAAQ
jgi:hypothetical protein